MEEQTQKKELISSRIADDGDFGNTISFVGNLGRDPEMNYTPDGKAHTKFSVGVWAGKGLTMWLNVSLWEELAEEAATKLRKGMRIKVVGRLRSYKWQGVDRFEVTGNWIQILLKREEKPIMIVEDTIENIEADKAWLVAHNLDETPY